MNQLSACRCVNGLVLLTALFGLFSALPTHAAEDIRLATPPPGKALVFVFRSDPQPLVAQLPVIVNTVLVGELANGTFITATVGPGRNFLRIGDQATSTLAVEANQSYFVRVRALGDPQSVRSEVHLVSEDEGRRSLARSRFAGVVPAAAAPPPQTPPVAISVAPPPKPSPTPVTAGPPTPKPGEAASPAATQPAARREMPTIAESGHAWDFALIAHAGTFKMADGNQVVAGRASTYDTTSKSVIGVEAEWRNKSGFAVGGEVFHYKNDLVSTATIPDAQQEVFAIMVNGKYYFHLASWFYPFVGIGVGRTNASYSGGLTGNANGPAYQGLAGMEFRFDRIGVNVQYRYLDSTTGSTGQEVKVGGSGILAGVSFEF